jgi:hypothetical protein
MIFRLRRTDFQIMLVPLMATFEGSRLDIGRWTDQHTECFTKRRGTMTTDSLPDDKRSCLATSIWRNQVRASPTIRHVKDGLERFSVEFIKYHVGSF